MNAYDVPVGQLNGSTLFPPSWQGLRQQIVYLAQFGNSIQVIHAEAGGGKSTFFNHLLQTGLGSTTLGVTVSDGAGLAAFFRDVLRELGLRPAATAGLGELVAALRGYVQTLHKERARAVLLVDDAHLLTDSELGALVSTLQGQADPGVGFHVVLFAEPGLAARIDALQVLDVEVHDAPLPVFSPSEISQLFKAQQAVAGALSPEQIQRIWYQSGGLPGAALDSLDQLRPPPAGAERVMSLRGLPIGHIAALVVLCGVLVWAFLVREPTESHQDETDGGAAIAIPSPAIAVEDPALTTPPADPQGEAAPIISGPISEVAVSAPVPVVAPGPAPVTSDQPMTTSEAGANLVAADPSPPVDVPSPPPPSQPLVPPAPSKPAGGATLAQSASAAQGAARLLSFPPNAYVLQLMAASAEEKLAAFVADQPNKHSLHMYQTARDGKVLFILVEGFYADRASAQAAIANLPQQQRSSGPWPKKIEQIHQEIRKNR